MRLGARDVVGVKVPVKVDRGVDLGHHGVRLGRKAATPHLIAHAWTFEVLPPMTVPLDTPAGRRVAVITVALVSGLLGLAAVYGMGGFARNPALAAECRQAAATAKR